MKRWHWLAAVVLLLACFAAQATRHVYGQDLTYDERSYFGLGLEILGQGRWEGRTLLHPPLSFYVAALPLLFRDTPPNPDDARVVLLGRLASLFLFAVPLLVGVTLWARELYGDAAALVALTLGAFSPTLLAHGPLTTPDAALSATGFFAVYLYWRTGGGRKPWLWALPLGLALLAKVTALLFVAVITLLGLSRLRALGVRRVAANLGSGLAMAWLLLCAGYAFYGLFDWRAKVELIERTQTRPFLRALALAASPLLPLPYLNTVGRQATIAAGRWPGYLLGEISFDGWRYYYVVALAVKETAPFLLLAAAALVSLRWLRPRKEELVLLLPFAVFFTAFSLSHVQIGIRYLLPALPFLFVFASRLTLLEGRARRPMALALPALLLGHAASTTLAGPDFISYFNELAGGPTNGWRYLADSNLDWGQNRSMAARWAEQHQALFDPLRLPAHGMVVLSTNRVQGILIGRPPYRLLWDEYARVAVVAPNYFAYDLDRNRRFPLESMVSVVSGPLWRTSAMPPADWAAPGLDDRAWSAVHLEPTALGLVISEAYPGTEGALMTCGAVHEECAFRHAFTLAGVPLQAALYLTTRGSYELYANGTLAAKGPGCAPVWRQEDLRLERHLHAGTNLLALRTGRCGVETGPMAFVEMRVAQQWPLP